MPAFNELERCLSVLGLESIASVRLQQATGLVERHHPPFSPDEHVLLFDLASTALAGQVKALLARQYTPNHPVFVVRLAEHPGRAVQESTLDSLDRLPDPTGIDCVHLPPSQEAVSLENLQDIVAHLRAPEGCPWDREQTHESLRTHILEETYETLSAIDEGNMEALAEELGDLLLQIVMQTQIAVEAGHFRMAEVVAGINRKLIRRHPHVFGETQVSGVQEVLRNWDDLKAAEREAHDTARGALGGLPTTLPALAQANELQVRAARAGFDWSDPSGVLDKIIEEVEELRGSDFAASEFGDLVFALVNLSRWHGIDAEGELRRANSRFRSRYEHMRRLIREDGKDPTNLTLEVLDRYWEIAKREVEHD